MIALKNIDRIEIVFFKQYNFFIKGLCTHGVHKERVLKFNIPHNSLKSHIIWEIEMLEVWLLYFKILVTWCSYILCYNNYNTFICKLKTLILLPLLVATTVMGRQQSELLQCTIACNQQDWF